MCTISKEDNHINDSTMKCNKLRVNYNKGERYSVVTSRKSHNVEFRFKLKSKCKLFYNNILYNNITQFNIYKLMKFQIYLVREEGIVRSPKKWLFEKLESIGIFKEYFDSRLVPSNHALKTKKEVNR